MRALIIASSLLTLAGCAGLPDPDPNQAWIDLAADDQNALHATQVDEKEWTDTRYFEVEPGRHELTVRLQFPVEPTNIGPVPAPLWRNCELNVTYASFDAGQRYFLEAGSVGFSPWARLYDEQRKLVSRAQPAGCQST
ncbi:hypothetical protein ASF66_18365 [Pseudomonas sp. Leaf129]|uniref:PA0061/PA0062 family lipoprotein n=1 Tax=Pseudomonas sp. Leaf129 TaxID=1736268 RepID=UPI000702C957|nr:hypothetical protein [Pseudomonas sp. Leaf129]KQQ58073.1 hypothetical protein ASF66_18365 [Pseudomonas sp. Leaf129]